MKKLLFLFVLGLSVPSAAEVVSSVSFNPSRLGSYSYLKVAQDSTFKGGLQSISGTTSSGVATPGEMNIKSNSGGVSMSITDTTSATPYFYIPSVVGAPGSSVNMPNTRFHWPSSWGQNSSYSSSSSSAPSTSLDVTVAGGEMAFSSDSYIGTLNGTTSSNGVGAAGAYHYVDNITNNTVSTLSITGNGGEQIGLAASGTDATQIGNESTLGFHLAGVDIPYPTGDRVTEKVVSLNGDASRSLCWVERKLDNGGCAVVLGFVNGTSCPSVSSSCASSGGDDGDVGELACSWNPKLAFASTEGLPSCLGLQCNEQNVGMQCSDSLTVVQVCRCLRTP